MVALQIRDVPDDVRDVLARTAAARGQSLQAYLLDVVRREARAVGNIDLFHATARLRVEIPDASTLAHVVREGRDDGFTVDRSGDDLPAPRVRRGSAR